MKKPWILLFVLSAMVFESKGQFSLEESFLGGVQGYQDFLRKNMIIPAAGPRQGRYGLCLVQITLHRNDTAKDLRIKVLSSPAKVYSDQTVRVFRLSKDRWKYPEKISADSVNLLAGIYYIKNGDDISSTRAGTHRSHAALVYDDLYKEYADAKFNVFSAELSSTPMFFLGIMTAVRYGTRAIE